MIECIAAEPMSSQGMVYLKYQSSTSAALGRTAMHGRFFGGKQIVAQFVPEDAYHLRYPESTKASVVLVAS